jgi:glutamyl-tRNA reductase
MYLIAAGLNHRTAPLEIREKLALGKDKFQPALGSLLERVEQGMLISTCNRTEVYAASAAEPPQGAAQEYLRSLGELPAAKLSPHLYVLSQDEVVRHLFKVAAGLDSMVVGEFEVLGQVRRSMAEAEQLKLLPMPLRRLFREAVRVGRRVRHETAISQDAASLSSVAVALARKLFRDLKGRRALVMSAGEAGELALEAVLKAGAFDVAITSRFYDKAERLANLWGGRALPYNQLTEGIADADLVITSSYAPRFLIRSPMIKQVMALRPHRPLLLIDIAVPRDIDPDVAKLPGVHLYDIDDLKGICEFNRSQREGEVEKALIIVEGEVERFMNWWDSLEAVPTIVALREEAESVRQAKLAHTLPRLQSLSNKDLAQIEAMTRSLVDKLLHAPISYVKENGAGAQRAKLVRQVFKLDE